MDDKRRRRLAEFIAPFRVKPDTGVTLAQDFDPRFKAGIKKKKEGIALLEEGVRLMTEYQSRLAAQDSWDVLVVLQALDAAGKDGTIRHVMSGVNPQGGKVHSFKVPSAEELDHDFLWRYARRLPARGEMNLQPLTLRGDPRGARAPGESRTSKASPGGQSRGCVGAALPADQRIGSAT